MKPGGDKAVECLHRPWRRELLTLARASPANTGALSAKHLSFRRETGTGPHTGLRPWTPPHGREERGAWPTPGRQATLARIPATLGLRPLLHRPQASWSQKQPGNELSSTKTTDRICKQILQQQNLEMTVVVAYACLGTL